MRTGKGFSVLELVLTLALLGVLGGVAFPAFRGYIERTRVNRAITDIAELSLNLYRWETNTGAFPATLVEAGLDGRVDPWGNAYVYLNVATAMPGEVRKDKNLVPINTDFDLYSSGRDGTSQPPLTAQSSRDDIVRANNGGFLGVAEDY